MHANNTSLLACEFLADFAKLFKESQWAYFVCW